MTTSTLTAHQPLLATADPFVRDEVGRLSAAAGLSPTLCPGADEALHAWRSADLVLVGRDLAPHIAHFRPPRRSRVRLVVDGVADPEDYRWALELGAEGVFELPGDTEELVALLGELADDSTGPGAVVGVLGGTGGAGASVFAAALAQWTARRRSALLMDLDPRGPGAGTLLGLRVTPAVGWETLSTRGGRITGQALRDTLPRGNGTAVLTWQALPTALEPDIVRDAVDAGSRGHDLVVLDLPRHPDLPADLRSRLDLVVVLARPDVTGLAGAGRTVVRLGTERVGAVVRGPRSRTSLVTDVAGAPVLATMSDQRSLTDAVDLGFGPARRGRGPLVDALRAVTAAIGMPASAR